MRPGPPSGLCSWSSTGECHLTGASGKPDVRGTIELLAE
jgi:hypothetical protein